LASNNVIALKVWPYYCCQKDTKLATGCRVVQVVLFLPVNSGEANVIAVKSCIRHNDHIVIIMPHFEHDRFQVKFGSACDNLITSVMFSHCLVSNTSLKVAFFGVKNPGKT